MPSTNLQTRVILSAEDRGVSRLLTRLETEADHFVDKYSQLGSVISTALGGIGVGFAVKQAMKQIEELKMDVNSIAVTLTDTVKGSSEQIQAAFKQNQKHAEAFFKFLRRQATQSLSDFGDLRNAYSIIASRGMSLDATEGNARLLSNVVDRIKLATKGQNSDLQITQELRSILSGTAKNTDALAKIFQARDANYIENIKGLVAGGNAQAIFEYLNTMLADIDLTEVVRGSMSKQLGRVRSEVGIWATEAFAPIYDILTDTFASVADMASDRGNPLFRGLASVVGFAEKLFSKLRDGVKALNFKDAAKDGTNWLAVFSESIPKLAGVALGAKSAATAFGLLAGAVKSSITAMDTLPGAVTVGVMGYNVARTYADTGKAPRYADPGRGGAADDSLDRFKYGLQIVLETIKQSVAALLRLITEWIPKAVENLFNHIMNSVYELGRGIDKFSYNLAKFVDQLGVKFHIDMLKDPEFEERRRMGESDVYRYTAPENPYASRLSKSSFELLQIEGGIEGMFSSILDNVEKRYFDRMNSDIRKRGEDSVSAVTGALSGVAEVGGLPAEATRRYKQLADEISKLTGLIEQIGEGGRAGVEEAVGSALARYRSIQKGIEGVAPGLGNLPGSYQVFTGLQESLQSYQEELKKTTDALERAEITERISQLGKVMALQEGQILEDLEAMREARLTEARERLADTMREAEAEARRTYAVKEADKMEQKYFSLAGSGQGALVQRIRELSGVSAAETEAEALKRKLEYENLYNAAKERELEATRKELDYMKEQDSLRASGGFFDAMKYSVNEYVHEAHTSFDAMVDFANEAGQSIQSAFSDSLYHVFRGDLDSMKDIFAGFCDSLLKAWTDMIAKMVVQQTTSALASSALGSLLGGFFGGGGVIGGVDWGGPGAVLAAANGGVFRGGFRAFARGGIATGPTLGLVGEGRYNEAVVPLPDGRSIPVVQRGGGANVIVNITDKSGAATSKTVNQRTDETGATVLDVVIEAISSNKRNFRNILKSVNA